MNPSAPAAEVHQAVKCQLAAEVLRCCGTLRTQVAGGSMLPAIWPGDTLVIERAVSDEIAEGDIVWFRHGDRFVVHRVVNKTHLCGRITIQTQGDSTLRLDSPILANEVLGKVAFLVRNEKCVAPRRTLLLPERAAATLIRRSHFAARVLMKVHQLQQCSRNSSSHDHVVSVRADFA